MYIDIQELINWAKSQREKAAFAALDAVIDLDRRSPRNERLDRTNLHPAECMTVGLVIASSPNRVADSLGPDCVNRAGHLVS